MVNEESKSGQEEMISIPKSEYNHFRECEDIAEGRTSFWIDALKNPDGTKALKEFFQGILETGLTFWGEKILKGQLWYSIYRITVVVILLGLIVGIATWLTSNGRLDAGAFTFLMGTIVGYILAFLTKIETVGSL
jgi:hypothetical protein